MGRHPAHQGGIPGQSLAQRGAGLSPLGPGVPRAEQAIRRVRPRDAHRQRQQFPRRPGQLLPRDAESHAGRHRQHGRLDLHGSADRVLADESSGRHDRLFLAGLVTSPPASGKRSTCFGTRSVPAPCPATAPLDAPPSPRLDTPPSRLSAVVDTGADEPRALGGGLSGWHQGRVAPGSRPARDFRRMVDYAPRTRGSPAASSTGSGPGCWDAASSTSRTIFATTTRRATRRCWPASRSKWLPAITTSSASTV